jgi:hypothetical protein
MIHIYNPDGVFDDDDVAVGTLLNGDKHRFLNIVTLLKKE